MSLGSSDRGRNRSGQILKAILGFIPIVAIAILWKVVITHDGWMSAAILSGAYAAIRLAVVFVRSGRTKRERQERLAREKWRRPDA